MLRPACSGVFSPVAGPGISNRTLDRLLCRRRWPVGTSSRLRAMSVDARPNVLLVDDRPENLLAFEASLGSLGYNLVRAESGRDALKRLLHEEFDAILLDVQMPEMDGFET